MFNYIWHTFFFDPVYNALVFFIDVIPGGDVGLAIIATVFLVKTILFPISIKAAKTQRIMKEIEPQLKDLKETHKDNKEAQAKAMMEIYRDAGMNPFASIILIIIQIPVVIALYFSVYKGGGVPLPNINTDLLYSFVAEPVTVSMNFLGMIDITQRSVLLAIAAAVTQYFVVNATMPKLPPKVAGEKPNMKDDFMRNMQLQMRYVMPVLIGVVAYTTSATIALYFLVSNIVALIQEIFVRKHR
jgi:YidC/Oxa1 family membrane protein insertase